MIGNRIEQFIENQGLNVSSFEKKIGASDGAIRKGIAKNSLGGKFIMPISEKFPNLSMDWLITGKGEMLKDTAVKEAVNVDYKEKYYELLEENRSLRINIEHLTEKLQSSETIKKKAV